MWLRLRHCLFCLKLLLLVSGVISQSAWALDTPWGSRLHGFAHQTFLWTDNNNFIVDTDDQVASAITDIGLTLTHEFNRNWKFNGQINSHKAGDTNDGDVDLDFAYAQWRLIDSQPHELSLVAGRVVMRYGLFNELRDVTHSRSSVFVPYSIYYDRFRSTIFSHDGVGFDYKYFQGFNHFRFEAAVANPRGNEEEVSEILPSELLQDGKSDGKQAYYFRTSYEQPLRARYMFSRVYLEWDYEANFINTDLDTVALLPLIPVDGNFDISSTGFSTQQFLNEYTLTLELFRHQVNYNKLLGGADLTANLNAVYGQVQLPCGPLLCMAQYEMLETLESQDVDSDKTEDMGIGLAWHFDNNILVRAEVHRVSGTAWLRGSDIADGHKNWTYVASQLAWKF